MRFFLISMFGLLTIAPRCYATLVSDKSHISNAEEVQLINIPAGASMDLLKQIVQEAKFTKKKISLRGLQHSQGGHTFYPRGIVLDLSQFNEIQLLAEGIVRAQAGATWKQMISFLDPLGFSVAVMQSDYDFSIGGTLSTNVHGWQLNAPPLIYSIEGFHILTANGKVRYCSRNKNKALFKAAIGGYGLLGIIIDVDLRIVPNNIYKLKQWDIDTKDFVETFKTQIQTIQNQAMFFGRLSVDRKNFLKKMILRVYEDTEQAATNVHISDSPRTKNFVNWLFGKTYQSDFFKRVRWGIEANPMVKKMYNSLSKNQLLYHSVDYYISTKNSYTDLLQEFFIPIEHFDAFIMFLQSLQEELWNPLMNITVRHVQQDKESTLNYAPTEMLCFVFLFRGPRTDEFDHHLKLLSRKITHRALQLSGTYYLPYRPYQTLFQFENAYPTAAAFKKIKLRYDPEEVFYNQFYQHYLCERGI